MITQIALLLITICVVGGTVADLIILLDIHEMLRGIIRALRVDYERLRKLP